MTSRDPKILEAVSFTKATKGLGRGRVANAGAATVKPREAKIVRTRGTDNRLLFAELTLTFLRATAGTAIARLSHRNSVCPSVRPSVTRVDQAKTLQATIIKSSPSAAPKTLVSGSVTLFQKFHRGHPNRGP